MGNEISINVHPPAPGQQGTPPAVAAMHALAEHRIAEHRAGMHPYGAMRRDCPICARG